MTNWVIVSLLLSAYDVHHTIHHTSCVHFIQNTALYREREKWPIGQNVAISHKMNTVISILTDWSYLGRDLNIATVCNPKKLDSSLTHSKTVRNWLLRKISFRCFFTPAVGTGHMNLSEWTWNRIDLRYVFPVLENLSKTFRRKNKNLMFLWLWKSWSGTWSLRADPQMDGPQIRIPHARKPHENFPL